MRLYLVRSSSHILNFPTIKSMAVFTTLEKAYVYCEEKNIPKTAILGIEPDSQEFGVYGEVKTIDYEIYEKLLELL